MDSRKGEHALFGMTSILDTFPAEEVKKLKGNYLPWIKEALKNCDEDLTWKRPKPGVNSIGNLLLHLNGNVRQWMLHGLGGEEDHRDRASEFSANDGPDRWTLYQRLEETVLAACEVILKPRTEEEWLRAVDIQKFHTTPLSAVIHIVEHFAYHTGQIVLMVKSATGKDLKFYNL